MTRALLMHYQRRCEKKSLVVLVVLVVLTWGYLAIIASVTSAADSLVAVEDCKLEIEQGSFPSDLF